MVEDFGFHLGHHSFHYFPLVYKYIHKMHHDHLMTYSLADKYAHPVEYIVAQVIPPLVGPFMLGKYMHMATAYTWFAIRAMEAIESHSGYEFSWSPFRLVPFASDYGYHSYHHSHNIGNYSSLFSTWDSVFGTNKAYFEYMEQEFTGQGKKVE